MLDRVTGVVRWFSEEKGYGFAVQDSGGANDVFLHRTQIGTACLTEGDRIEFAVTSTAKGPRAIDVRAV